MCSAANAAAATAIVAGPWMPAVNTGLYSAAAKMPTTAALAPAKALAAFGLARRRSQNGITPTTNSAAGKKIATVAIVAPHNQLTPCAEAPKNDANVNSGPGTACAAP